MGWTPKQNNWRDKATTENELILKGVGELGALCSEIEEEFFLWKVFQHYPIILTIVDKISFEDLQKIYAICQMNEDTEKAVKQYYKENFNVIESLNK